MGKNITDFKNALVYIVYQLVFLGKTLESLQLICKLNDPMERKYTTR